MKIFNEQHEMFRATVRSFVDKEIAPHIEEWEAAGRMPRWIGRVDSDAIERRFSHHHR